MSVLKVEVGRTGVPLRFPRPLSWCRRKRGGVGAAARNVGVRVGIVFWGCRRDMTVPLPFSRRMGTCSRSGFPTPMHSPRPGRRTVQFPPSDRALRWNLMFGTAGRVRAGGCEEGDNCRRRQG